eukprot:5060470-Prymnesium_polylepis.4
MSRSRDVIDESSSGTCLPGGFVSIRNSMGLQLVPTPSIAPTSTPLSGSVHVFDPRSTRTPDAFGPSQLNPPGQPRSQLPPAAQDNTIWSPRRDESGRRVGVTHTGAV